MAMVPNAVTRWENMVKMTVRNYVMNKWQRILKTYAAEKICLSCWMGNIKDLLHEILGCNFCLVILWCCLNAIRSSTQKDTDIVPSDYLYPSWITLAVTPWGQMWRCWMAFAKAVIARRWASKFWRHRVCLATFPMSTKTGWPATGKKQRLEPRVKIFYGCQSTGAVAASKLADTQASSLALWLQASLQPQSHLKTKLRFTTIRSLPQNTPGPTFWDMSSWNNAGYALWESNFLVAKLLRQWKLWRVLVAKFFWQWKLRRDF